MSEDQIHSLLAKTETTIDALCAGEPGSLKTILRTHFSAGGSRVRARLALEAGLALGLEEAITVAIAAGCELFHNASLIHDDLQDRDTIRRDAPSVWAAHGENAAICAGDHLLSAAYAALAGAGPHAARLIAHAHHRVARVIAGQWDDLNSGSSCVEPSAYERIAAAKSGPLLALPLELALMAAGKEELIEPASEAATCFAIAYQMLDDLADADRDAANGALNAVVVHAAMGHPHPRQAVRAKAMQHLDSFSRHMGRLPPGLARALMARAEPIRNALGQEAAFA